jgi:hypothetical protein
MAAKSIAEGEIFIKWVFGLEPILLLQQENGRESKKVPQPIRGTEGFTDSGPRNVMLDRQNPDNFMSACYRSWYFAQLEIFVLYGTQ